MEIIAGFPIAISPNPAAVAAEREAANHTSSRLDFVGRSLCEPACKIRPPVVGTRKDTGANGAAVRYVHGDLASDLKP